MSGLRDFVTGADGCTAGDGAGPSNAAQSLVDTLLGGRSKQQQQLQEVRQREADRPRLQRTPGWCPAAGNTLLCA